MTRPFRKLLEASGIRWRALVRDSLVIACWVGLATLTWFLVAPPLWLYYSLVVGGILTYSLLTAPWLDRDTD